jgi:hypothetical protein
MALATWIAVKHQFSDRLLHVNFTVSEPVKVSFSRSGAMRIA